MPGIGHALAHGIEHFKCGHHLTRTVHPGREATVAHLAHHACKVLGARTQAGKVLRPGGDDLPAVMGLFTTAAHLYTIAPRQGTHTPGALCGPQAKHQHQGRQQQQDDGGGVATFSAGLRHIVLLMFGKSVA